MLYIGDITLPDGRIVHAKVSATYERDTNAVNVHDGDLYWQDGSELTADEYNMRVNGMYLHEFVTDKVLLLQPDYEDLEPL